MKQKPPISVGFSNLFLRTRFDCAEVSFINIGEVIAYTQLSSEACRQIANWFKAAADYLEQEGQ